MELLLQILARVGCETVLRERRLDHADILHGLAADRIADQPHIALRLVARSVQRARGPAPVRDALRVLRGFRSPPICEQAASISIHGKIIRLLIAMCMCN